MLAFLDDIGIQLILVIVAGVIWAIGKVVTASQNLRHRTRMKMEQQEQRRKLQFEPRSEYTAAKPAAEPPRPVRRPPRKKKRVVRRRVIRRTVRKAQPSATPPNLLAMLRNRRRLRDAIVLREILGPPKAMRGRRPF